MENQMSFLLSERLSVLQWGLCCVDLEFIVTQHKRDIIKGNPHLLISEENMNQQDIKWNGKQLIVV